MSVASAVFFYPYALLLVVAGAWGALLARTDLRLVLGVRVASLPPDAAANLLSQYRFLRAIELGFGLFALVWRRQIHRERAFNVVFLSVMAAGVAARLLGAALDGSPSPLMWFFAIFELVGVVVIFLATRGARRAASP